MPAVIAVKINNSKIKAQEKNTSAEAGRKTVKENSEGSVRNGEALKKDFKKLLEKNLSKNSSKKINHDNVKAPGKKKAGKGKETDPENLNNLQGEMSAGMKSEAEKLKNGNIINFDADLKPEEANLVKKEVGENISEKTDLNTLSLHAAANTAEQKNTAVKTDSINNEAKNKKNSIDPLKAEADKKEDVKLKVLDLRTAENSGKNGSEFSGSEKGGEKFDLLLETADQKNDSSETQIKDALIIKAEPAADIKNDVPVKSLTAQQNAVLEKLRADGNAEIVKQTKMILSDNNSGELRMVLKPERLGYVRIKLNLDDNNIVGRIIVDNNNIKEIFENNMDNLLRNFRESGFSSASLEVSVGGEKGSQQNMENNERFFSKKIIEDVDSHNVIDSRNSMDAETLVDLVV